MSKVLLIPVVVGCVLLTACSDKQSEMESVDKSQAFSNGVDNDCGPKIKPIHITDYQVQVNPTMGPLSWENLTITLSPREWQELSGAPFKIRFSLLSEAYACPLSWFVTEQAVTHFSITSDAYFTDDLPPGSELKQYFMDVEERFNMVSYPSIDQTVAPTNLSLSLLQAPLDLRHNFTISVEFSDGNISEVQTGEITLTQ